MELKKLNEISEFLHKVVGELEALQREHLFPRAYEEVVYYVSDRKGRELATCSFEINEFSFNIETLRIELFLSDEYSVHQLKLVILEALFRDMTDILWYIYSQEFFLWDEDIESSLDSLAEVTIDTLTTGNYRAKLREYLEKAYSIITGKNIGT